MSDNNPDILKIATLALAMYGAGLSTYNFWKSIRKKIEVNIAIVEKETLGKTQKYISYAATNHGNPIELEKISILERRLFFLRKSEQIDTEHSMLVAGQSSRGEYPIANILSRWSGKRRKVWVRVEAQKKIFWSNSITIGA